MLEKARIAVLISGGGTNLQALIGAQRDGILKSGEIVLVVSSNPNAYGLRRAEKAEIESLAISEKDLGGMRAFENVLYKKLIDKKIDFIILAGFMKILSPEFVSHYPDRIINIHPSLIPSFCGRGAYGIHVHEMALDYGVKITGATVHLVNEIADGGKILLQKAVAVHDGDTPETLQLRVMEEAEWKLLPEAAEMISKRIMEEKQYGSV